MKRLMLGALMAVGLTASMPSYPVAQDRSADELAVEGLSKLMDALSVFLESIPQYEAPEVLENGDIIIRRKNPDAPEKEQKDPELEKTAT